MDQIEVWSVVVPDQWAGYEMLTENSFEAYTANQSEN